jgi:putative peptidoglycan lipid II flippase
MRIARLAFGVGALTFISRIFGYIRDIAIAFFLGASIFNDAFIIALRLPNIFRSIFGEGALSSAFVPIFSNKLKHDGEQKAKRFASNIQTILLIVTLLFSAVMMYFMADIVRLFAPGYIDNPEVINLATSLGFISFPYIIFISMMAFYGSISNTLGKYMPFASAPIILNILLIAFIFLGDSQEEKAYWLSISLPIAGIFEMLWVMYFVYMRVGLIKLKTPKIDEDTKLLLKRIIPGIISSGVSQINILISTIIASFVASGVSYLYYADRIYQLPLAIIGTALGTVMLPELSKKFAKSDIAKFKVIQSQAVVFSMFLTMPAAFGIIAIAPEIIAALFQYGAFTQTATAGTAAALRVFAFGLPMFCFIKVFSAAFFAVGDTKTPMKVAALVLIANIAFSFLLLPFLRHVAVAVGSVVASYINAVLLGYLLDKRGLYAVYKQFIIQTFKILAASVTMFAIVIMAKNILNVESRVLSLLLYLSIAFITYFSACFALKVPVKKLMRK